MTGKHVSTFNNRNITNMKHLLLAVAAIIATFSLQAQQKEIPANIRMEVAEVEKDNAKYEIFTYKDDDGTFGYYLSLGGASQIFSISKNGVTDFSIEDARETCLWLGATSAEALATLDTIFALYDREAGTVVQFQGRTTAGADRLTDPNTTTCTVQKRLLGGKRLVFTFTSGRRECGVYLNKGIVKQLRFGLKTDIKLHPKQHR